VIKQQVGDVLEIHLENRWYYVVVLTKIVMFGGNIVFAYHNDGQQLTLEQLMDLHSGFNICTDLLWVKKKGLVRRIGKVAEVEPLFRSKYMKSLRGFRREQGIRTWYIYDVHDLRRRLDVVNDLPDQYKAAMDSGTYSFEMVARKILARYGPDQKATT
jgi:hypothetical protein